MSKCIWKLWQNADSDGGRYFNLDVNFLNLCIEERMYRFTDLFNQGTYVETLLLTCIAILLCWLY